MPPLGSRVRSALRRPRLAQGNCRPSVRLPARVIATCAQRSSLRPGCVVPHFLLAALNTATGTVIGKCSLRHRAVEFKNLPAIIDKQVPSELEIHLELGNYVTHKTEMIHNWLPRRPRCHLRYTPKTASWLNHVKHSFGEITRQSIRCGSFRSTMDLKQAINHYLEDYNENPKPIVWTKAADEILESSNS